MSKVLSGLTAQLDLDHMPRHVAIIMDGNGRWARQRHRPRLYGHRAGAKAVRQVVEIAGELHIPHLTIYAFSTENWSRPEDEVSGLFKLLMEYLKKEIDELNRKNVVLRLIGSPEHISRDFLARAHDITRKTWNNTGLHLNVLFNYGGRQEIIDAVKLITSAALEGALCVQDITPEMFSAFLYTKNMPDPDLVIRTSGEMRLSNLLTWQTAYAELYVTDTLWPDFGKAAFVQALLDFQGRKRRFGGTGE
jgi:undecaprenyl diphosphate synthase